MKIYFAGYTSWKDVNKVPEAHCLLESYLNFRTKDFRQWHIDRGLTDRDLFLDSGAFSAFTQGTKIDLDHYIGFIIKNADLLTVYATLDVIGDWQATQANTEYMESKGLKPLPTFHFGSPRSELEKMIKKYDYIALGGLVPLAMKRTKMRDWLDYCFTVIKADTKVHGFGVNGMWAWERYPFYSVDATSWLKWAAYRRGLRFEDGKMKPIEKTSEKSILTMKAHESSYGLNKINVLAYTKAGEYATELWKKRGVVWEN